MKKNLFLSVLLILLFAATAVKAQPVVVVNESFDNASCSFSALRGGWGVDSSLKVSGKSSFIGVMPTQIGDSVELVSNWFDCSNYSNVMLQFSHICKISDCDFATVEFQIDQLGAKWQKLPLDGYKGIRTPYRQLKFHHKSYDDWMPDDSLAIPTNSWWKTEVFDLSADVAWERVRFKFKLKHGSVAGTQFANGWSVDDFIIYASNGQIALPEVYFLMQPSDTAYTTGPFKVKAKVATRTMSPIIQPVLEITYTFNNVKSYDTIPMTNVEGDSIWEAFIPQHPYGTEITYSITGRDTMKNEKTISGAVVLKRFIATGKLGYVVSGQYVGGGTYAFPTWKNYAYGWTKAVYSNYEMGGDGLITRLAYEVPNNLTGLASKNQFCYFKAVSDSVITNTAWIDPISDGATLVWTGTWDPSVAGWREITLDNPFILPYGKHLMVIWVNQDGTAGSPYAAVRYQSTTGVQALYATSATGTGTIPSATDYGYYKPVARFLKSGSSYQNSVSLLSLDAPSASVIANVATPVKVTIRNEGLKNLTKCTINWSVNGTAQTPYNWTGNLLDNYTDSNIQIGTYVPRTGVYDNLVIWVSDPNGVLDSCVTDDTLKISTYGCSAPFSGKYVVGPNKGADFPTFADAVAKITLCGSNGNVHLLLQDGNYTSLAVTDMSASMGNDTLFITSQSGDREKVVFNGNGTYMVNFNNAHNVVLKGVSLIQKATGSTSYGIQFAGACSNIEVRDCYVYMDTNVTSSGYYAVYRASNAAVNDNIRFIHNEIHGGYYGVYFYGSNSTSAYSTNMVFDSNLVHGAYYYGYYFYYNHFKSFSHNTFLPRVTNNNTYMYNYLYYTNLDICEGNRFDYYNFPGNYIYNSYYYINRNNTKTRGLFCNNEYIGNKAANGGYGMYVGYSDLDIYNNTFVTKGSYPIYMYNYNQGTANLLNNVFVNLATTGTYYPLYIPSAQVANGVGTIDYNLYYSKTSVGYWVGNKTSLNAWQQATGQDANSVYMKPTFYYLPDLDTLNAHPEYYDSSWTHSLKLALYNGLECPVPAGVTRDIDGTPRAGFTIMGCYAATPSGLDAAISGVDGITASVVKGQKNTVKAILTNMGEDTLTSANIGWSLNGVSRPGRVWTGSLATYASDTVLLDTLSSYVMENRLKVWVGSPNNGRDANVKNDTLYFNFRACDSLYHGSYTVGETNADFASLEDAFLKIRTCGVDGPMVLNIQKGTYKPITMSEIPGVSAANSITITSATGSASDVVVAADGGYAAELNSIKHIRFSNLTFDGTLGTGAVNMPGRSVDVRFDGCVFRGPSGSSTSYCFYHTGGACDSIFIQNCTFDGGYYGLYFYGSGTGTGGYNTNIFVDSNLLTNAYYYSHYFYYTDLNSFCNNRIKVTTVNNYHYCYFYYTNHYNTSRNSWDFTGSNCKYPYIYYYYPHRYNASSTDGYIVNNEVINRNDAEGGYCMYLGYPGGTQHIWHNSFYSPSASGYGIYAYLTSGGSNASVDISNNLIWSNNYPIYTSGNVVPLTSDYNNLYNASGRLASLNGAAITSISAWATATGDNSTVSVQPMFLSPEMAGLELVSNTGITCPALNSVPEDITGFTRNATTTIGCYEYNPKSNDMYMVSIVNPTESKVLVAGDTVPVVVCVRNLGSNSVSSFKINWQHNDVSMTQKSWTGNLASMGVDTVYVGHFTAVSGGNRIKVWTSLPNNVADQRPVNDTASVSAAGCDSLFSGTFTLGRGGDFKDFDEFVTTVGSCGLGGPITLKLLTGSYDCMVLDKAINGTSAVNTITITSAAGNADSVIIYNSTGMTPTVVFGNGIKHVILEKVTVKGASYTNSGGVWAGVGVYDCDSITIRKCKILCDADEYSYEEGSGITSIEMPSYTYHDFGELWIEDNLITGVRYGLYMEPNSLPGTLHFVRNDMRVRYVVANLWAVNLKDFSYNTFSFDVDSNASNQDYIYLAEIYGKFSGLDTLRMVGNRWLFYDAPVSYTYGYIEEQHPDSCFLFANNEFVYPKNARSDTYIEYHDKLHFINNSIYFPVGGSFYLSYNNTPIVMRNNNMVAGGGNTFDLVLDNNRFLSSDYNNVYGMSLADLKRLTGMDTNSVSLMPTFTNVQIGLNMLDNSGLDCPMHPSVTTDINLKSRSTLTTIGCYEVEACGNNIMPRAMVSPTNVCIVGSTTPLTVTVLNAGSNTITSFNVNTVVNGISLRQYNWTGSLAPKSTVNVTLGSFVPKSDTNYITIWTSRPNSGVDSLPANDTLRAFTLGCDSILNGDYIVKNNSELNAIIGKLTSCGVNGPVRVLLADGRYTVPDIQTDFIGTSHNNSVTFESQSGNPDSVVLVGQFNIGGINHVNFRNMTFTYNTERYVIYFQSRCTDIEFYGCKFLASETTTSTGNPGSYCIYKPSGWTLDSLRFIKNYICGGYYGLYIYGSGSNSMNSNIIVDSNTICNQYYYSSYMYYNEVESYSHNVILSRTANVSNYWYGIMMYYSNVPVMNGNRVHQRSASISYPYLAYIYYNGRYGTERATNFTNNELMGRTTGSYYGMYVYYSNVNIFHNTIRIDGTGAARGIYSGGTGCLHVIKNNIIVTMGSASHPIYEATAGSSESDYNCLYAPSNAGYSGGAMNFNTWKAAGHDVHSVFMSPVFTMLDSNEYLKLSSYSGLFMPMISSVTSDRLGKPRAGMSLAGAYTQDAPKTDAALVEFVNWSNSAIIGASTPVNVRLINMGYDNANLTSARINWYVNGVKQTIVSWTGNLAPYEDTVVTLGSFLPVAGNNVLAARVYLPNASADMETSNDSIYTKTYGCDSLLHGTYTVATTGASRPKFRSIEDALAALTNCGVDGPTTFLIGAGSYNALTLGEFEGASHKNMVTFTSASGDSSDVVISGTYHLTLNSTKHVRFDRLTFGKNNGTRGVTFSGRCHDIEFYHCDIMASPTATSSSYYAVYKPSGAALDSIRFIGNHISGGYYAMYFYGSSTSNGGYNTNIIFDSNLVENAYYYSYYFYYNDILSFCHNTILPRVAGYTYQYNYLYYCNLERMEGNRYNTTRNNTINYYYNYAYYINRYNVRSDGRERGLICNNEVINTRSNGYGWYLGYGNIDFINNSIFSPNGQYALYSYNDNNTKLVLRNNNVVANTGEAIRIYNINGDNVVFDNNNLYGGNGCYINNASYMSYNDLVAATGDTNLIVTHPVFIDSTVSLEQDNYVGMSCYRDSSVMNDITGQSRSIITSVGAYSISVVEGKNMEMTQVISPKLSSTVACYPDYSVAEVEITNKGTEEIDFSVNPVKVCMSSDSANVFYVDTILSAGVLRPMARMNVKLTDFFPTSYTGFYNIKAWVELAADSTSSDDTAYTVYEVTRVVLPFETDFSSIPLEFAFDTIQGKVQWELASDSILNASTIQPAYGKSMLHFASSTGKASLSRAVIKQVDLQGSTKPKVSFWYQHDNANPNSHDYVELLASTDGGLTYTRLMTVYRYDANCSKPTWKMYQYDLSAYVNETCLHLAFEAGSYAGGDQNIDRIQIQVEQDVEVAEFQITDSLSACSLTNRQIAVVMNNSTLYDVNYDRPDSIYLHVNLMKPDSSVTTIKKVMTGRLLANTSDTVVVCSDYDFSMAGTYGFYAYVDTVTFTTDVTNDSLYYSFDVLPDLAVVKMDAIGNKNMGDVVIPTVYVVNTGNLTAEKVQLRMKVNDENDIVEVYNNPLKVGDTLKYTFTQGFTVPQIDPDQPYYFLSIESEMSCDMDATNDVCEFVGGVNLIDLSVYSIENPKGSGFGCDSGRKEIYVNINLYNYSDVAVDTATVHVVVDSANTVYAEFTEVVTNIAIGNTNMSLHTPYRVPNFTGDYKVIVYVENVNGEMNNINDTASIEACAIYNDVAVPQFDGEGYSLGQNIPNPANVSTVIPFAVPEDATVTLTVMSVSGQMLYATEIQATAGENNYELNVNALAAGIYYYTMEYKGQRLVRKMNVVK